MPTKIKRPCNKVGCGVLTDKAYCDKHAKEKQQQHDSQRGSAHERGYTWKWRKYSTQFLRLHPLCECDECKQLIVPLPAEVTDHIIPHKGDQTLFWDPSNHQALAKRCHDKKTAREDGGFGRG